MKINIEIDLSDMYCDSEGETNFNEQILQEISFRATNTIMAKLSEKAQTIFKERIEKHVNKEFDKQVTGTVVKLFKSKKIRKGVFDTNPVSFDEHIQQLINKRYFNEDSSLNDNLTRLIASKMTSFDKQLEKRAEEIIKNLQSRYDTEFASMIVQKLQTKNMLAPNIAELLINKPE